jgi:hypothetical protein
MVEKVRMGNRDELNRWYAFIAANTARFATVERFTHCGRKPTEVHTKVAYEVATFDVESLRRAYVLHRQSERQIQEALAS